jgi:lipopolysaccharide transport system ATP-binding protein
MKKPVITLQNADVTFKSGLPLIRSKTVKHALCNVSFELYQGESLGIVGRNGSGKSTLLQLLAGILKPDGGAVINHGFSTSLLALQPGFDLALNGRSNVVNSGMLMGLKRGYIEQHIDHILDYSELGDAFEQPVRTYSAGMKARLGFALSTHIKSDVLLIDEALSVGDVSFRAKSKATMVKRLQSGDTIVLVSHYANEVRELCDRAIWIEDGAIIAAGDPRTTLEGYNLKSTAL